MNSSRMCPPTRLSDSRDGGGFFSSGMEVAIVASIVGMRRRFFYGVTSSSKFLLHGTMRLSDLLPRILACSPICAPKPRTGA